MSDMLTWVNATRAANGLPRLRAGGYLLDRYATKHAKQMAESASLWHGNVGEYLRLHDRFGWYWGENIGATSPNQKDPIEALHKAFVRSPDHKRNLLNPRFHRLSVGYAEADGVLYCTEAFRA